MALGDVVCSFFIGVLVKTFFPTQQKTLKTTQHCNARRAEFRIIPVLGSGLGGTYAVPSRLVKLPFQLVGRSVIESDRSILSVVVCSDSEGSRRSRVAQKNTLSA